MAYAILKEEEFSEKVATILKWTETSIDSLEKDDIAITSQMANISVFLGRVIRDEAETSIALEILESEKRSTIRELKLSSGEKVTERGLEDIITQDPDVQELRRMYASTKSRTIITTNLVQAINNGKRQFIERNKERINHEIKTSRVL